MALTAMWTHGNAVIPEIPERLEKITRFGFGTELKVRPNVGTQWVHVPMPSPVLLAGARPKLRRVLILSKSSSTVHQSFDRVHIFDGNDRVQELFHSETFSADLTRPKVYNTGQQSIFKALGISMQLPGSSQPYTFFFAGFGADWE